MAQNKLTLSRLEGLLLSACDDLRGSLMRSVAEALKDQTLLTPFQVRGAFANFVNQLKADFKSIAASGWGPELIPDDDILQSQFPEILEEMEHAHTRLAELQALFSAADEEDFEDNDDTGVLPSDDVKSKKEELKNLNADWKAQLKEVKATIRGIEQKRDELVQSACLKISRDEARVVILERLRKVFLGTYSAYLRTDQRACVAAIENLWNKYAVTAKQIEAERDAAAHQLQAFLVELGYE